MAEQPLFTFQDAVDHVSDVFDIAGLDATSKHFRAAKRAVADAYRDIVRLHEWSYYERHGQITTEAEQSSSTITYDHTGGTYERMVTIAAGTWPTNARYMHIIIESQRYKVATRESSTVITLTPDTNPGADVAAGTSYNIFRSVYPLPVNFRRMSPLIDLKNNWMLKYIPPGKVMHALVGRYQPQDPDSFTIRNQGDFYGGLSVEMLPPPSIARTYDFAGEFDPRALTTYKYNTGTVSSTAGTTTVTGSATVFADAHIGDVIRFAKDSTDTPDGLYGDPGGTDTPYVSQRVILAVASTTSVTIDASVPATISGVNYSISSPLDIPTNDMMNLFQRMCESGYRNLNPRECGIKERQEARMEVQSALILAMRADVHDRSDGLYDRSGWSTLDDLALRGTAAVNSSI